MLHNIEVVGEATPYEFLNSGGLVNFKNKIK